MSWNKIIECVPNFSEGRDLEKIDQIVAPFRIKAGVKLLDYSNGCNPCRRAGSSVRSNC